MQFSIFASVAFAAAALAQSISFTSFPGLVMAGHPVTLTYTGSDLSAPAKITLRQGPKDDLQDVAVLTSSATGGKYTWTPSKSLPNADNYALQISQGNVVNYGTEFSLSGGSAASSSTTGSLKGYSTRMPIPLATGMTYGSGNSTYAFGTATAPPMGTASATGTGMPMMANTTFSSATLTAPTAGSNGAAGTAAGPSAAATTSSKPANAAGQLGSSLALVAGAVVACVFLN